MQGSTCQCSALRLHSSTDGPRTAYNGSCHCLASRWPSSQKNQHPAVHPQKPQLSLQSSPQLLRTKKHQAKQMQKQTHVQLHSRFRLAPPYLLSALAHGISKPGQVLGTDVAQVAGTVGVDSQANSLARHLHILCQEGGLKVLGQDTDGVCRRDCASFSFNKDQDGHCSLLCRNLQVSDAQKSQSFGEYSAPCHISTLFKVAMSAWLRYWSMQSQH